MKVYLGPFVYYYGPYQIADLLRFVGVSKARRQKIAEWLDDTWFSRLCNWIYDKRKRTIRVKLHYYDHWDAEDTIAHIAVPLLRQLRIRQQGAPFTDDEDAPEHLRSTAPNCKKPGEEGYSEHSDENFHDRWFWIFDEIIWALDAVIHEPEDICSWARDDFNAYYARRQNGLRLFGKYFMSLWD